MARRWCIRSSRPITPAPTRPRACGLEHRSYDAQADRWEFRTPLPTPRSGHGRVLYRGKVFVMGGEGTNRVFGQYEAWDPTTDRWEVHAPMLTPRHGMGAVVVGDVIVVAGGGPQTAPSLMPAWSRTLCPRVRHQTPTWPSSAMGPTSKR